MCPGVSLFVMGGGRAGGEDAGSASICPSGASGETGAGR
jgi:hypothetical protein